MVLLPAVPKSLLPPLPPLQTPQIAKEEEVEESPKSSVSPPPVTSSVLSDEEQQQDYDNMSHAELKAACEAAGISSKGNRRTLAKRLRIGA